MALTKLEEQRSRLVEMIPECIDVLDEIIKNPGRNSQTQLAAIKTVMDRAGLPAVAATEITGKDGVDIFLSVADTLRRKREQLAKGEEAPKALPEPE